MSGVLGGLFASGLIADLIVALIALEGLGLALLARRGRGPGLAAVWPTLLSGAFLVLALRAALTGAGWPWVALFLALALAAHATDLWLRPSHSTG